MARLTYGARKHMPESDFALPAKRKGGKGGYPIEDKAHARDALSRVSADGTPEQQREVDEKVHKRFPGIGQKDHEKREERSAHRERRSMVPRGEHHENHHREPRNHGEFERLGNARHEKD